MFKEMGQVMSMLKNLPKMQAEMEKLQQRIALITAEGVAGGNMVTVKMNGKMEVLSCTIADYAWQMQDKELLESGGKLDFRFGDTPGARFEPVTVDGTFKDSDTIALGGTVLTAHHHPGHTKGATSFTLNVQEGGKTYRVVIANMGSINPGVTVAGSSTASRHTMASLFMLRRCVCAERLSRSYTSSGMFFRVKVVAMSVSNQSATIMVYRG